MQVVNRGAGSKSWRGEVTQLKRSKSGEEGGGGVVNQAMGYERDEGV